MSVFRSILLALLLMGWSGVTPAVAENRVALVIGNGAYQNIGALPNPPNDMSLMTSTLRSLNFEVISAVDADLVGMRTAVQAFGRRLETLGPDTVALFYYAGHGLQTDGVNFLVPTDAAIQRPTDIVVETINLDWVISQMEYTGNRMNLVIIDACRDNPIARSTRSGLRGLAQVDAPRGTLIAYATAPGAVALDGTGTNSPYSEALARNLQVPGLSVEEVFRQTRVEVLEVTSGNQTPWESSSLTGAFYFKEGAPEAEPEVAAVNPAPDTLSTGPSQQELLHWESIMDSDEPALFEDYLTRFPEGMFESIAVAKLDALKDESTPAPERVAPAIAKIEDLDRLMYVQERANFRAEPATSGALVATLDTGTEVQVTGKVAESDWYQVHLEGGDPAFVWQPLLGPDAPEVDVSALPDAAASGPPPAPADMSGRWTGRYRCQQDVIGVTVELVERPDHSLEGVFSFYALPGHVSFPEGSFAVAGHVDPGSKQFRLKSGDWIDRPHGLQSHDLRGEIGGDNRSITGRILTTGCADIALER